MCMNSIVSNIINRRTTNISRLTSYNIEKLNWLIHQMQKKLGKNK